VPRKKPDFVACTVKELPEHRWSEAAELAMRLFPGNAPRPAHLADDGPPTALKIAALTTKYWGAGGVKLGVGFMETATAELRRRILLHMNAWGAFGNVQFSEASRLLADVRIAFTRGEGYYSYLGPDCRLVPTNEKTMNLDSFTAKTPEGEYRRVVRHETGHVLGFPHEHMRTALVARIDPAKAYAYFLKTQGWKKSVVDQQVLTPISEALVKGLHTEEDQDSIMCYRLPGTITRDGLPVRGGDDIDEKDGQFCSRIYPRPTRAVVAGSVLEDRMAAMEDKMNRILEALERK